MTQSAAQNWDRHWNRMLLETRQKPIPAPTGSLKRFLQRAGGIELAFQVVLRELRHTYGKRILEAGCGSGEISLRLARRGNQVFMLDVSHSALQLAKDAARDIDKAPFFIQGSIFNLPFREEAFDFIFNIGVLDHFGPTRRKEAVRELLRGARASANVLILLNDAHSWVHPPAMRHALKKAPGLSDLRIPCIHWKSPRRASSARPYPWSRARAPARPR